MKRSPSVFQVETGAGAHQGETAVCQAETATCRSILLPRIQENWSRKRSLPGRRRNGILEIFIKTRKFEQQNFYIIGNSSLLQCTVSNNKNKSTKRDTTKELQTGHFSDSRPWKMSYQAVEERRFFYTGHWINFCFTNASNKFNLIWVSNFLSRKICSSSARPLPALTGTQGVLNFLKDATFRITDLDLRKRKRGRC